jgi:hypothetical protein
MNRALAVIAALLGVCAAGCGYRPPAEVKAIRGDWIADGNGPGSFEVLILDPSMDQEFYWYESHKYTNGRLAAGSSGNFKYEPGKIALKLPVGYTECEIAAVTANELQLRANGAVTTYRRMADDDYDRVDWTVSKIPRLKERGGPREPGRKAKAGRGE